MVAQEREDMHLCQWGICYSNFMAGQIIRQECHCTQADSTLAHSYVFNSEMPWHPGLCSLYCFLLLSFFLDLNWDPLHINLLSFLAIFFLQPHSTYSPSSVSPSLKIFCIRTPPIFLSLLLAGVGWGLSRDRGDRNTRLHKSQGVEV